jgi:Protein of unknown function (DUF3102)
MLKGLAVCAYEGESRIALAASLSERRVFVAKKSKTELVTVGSGFDYAALDRAVAEQLRTAAKSIREKVKRTIEHIIEVGFDLLKVKDALPHGQFGPWLASEFGWTDRLARRFMDVAEVFGPKSDIISDLAIAPTAAYLLAAPSTPYEARQVAVERAKSGETITAAVAKEILGTARKKAGKKGESVPSKKLRQRLERVLDRFREQWNQKEFSELACQLREFADGLEKAKPNERKMAKP